MPAAQAQPSRRASSPSRCWGRRHQLSLVVRARLRRTMQVQQHARGCGTTSWRSHCFHKLCRMGPQTVFGSHKNSLTAPRTFRAHRASHRHIHKSSAAGATHSTVTCQAQEPAPQRMNIQVGNTQVSKVFVMITSGDGISHWISSPHTWHADDAGNG